MMNMKGESTTNPAFRIPHSALHIRGGFSLTEVVLAVAIVAVACVGVMTAFPTGLKAGRDARDDSMIAMIAQDVFARLRGGPYDPCRLPYTSGTAPLFQSVRLPLRYPGNQGSWGYPGPNNAFHYALDGRPANESSNPSRLGCAPRPEDSYAPDEGYYCMRVFVITNPYANSGYETVPSSLAEYGNNNLTKVILDFSWPARSPLTPTDHRKHKLFVTYIANLR
jgi:prepilin-type N-terminal cleavage/methylation domain-containing protein